MKKIFDINGLEIKEGDKISMPHGNAQKSVNGRYTSKVFYNESKDRLETDDGYGFQYAYGVVKES